jgi:hypothetical protein
LTQLDAVALGVVIHDQYMKSRIIPSSWQSPTIQDILPHPFRRTYLSDIYTGMEAISNTKIALKSFRRGESNDSKVRMSRFLLLTPTRFSISPQTLRFRGPSLKHQYGHPSITRQYFRSWEYIQQMTEIYSWYRRCCQAKLSWNIWR